MAIHILKIVVKKNFIPATDCEKNNDKSATNTITLVNLRLILFLFTFSPNFIMIIIMKNKTA